MPNENIEDPLAKVLAEITPEEAASLSQGLLELSNKYFAMGRKMNPKRLYHQIGHFIEMFFDAGLSNDAASTFLSDQQLELYVTLVQAMHAAHDIEQEQTQPGENERLSAEEFKADFAQLVNSVLPQHAAKNELLKKIADMADAVIIDATRFNLTEYKTPALIDFMAGRLKQPKSIALAMLRISLNDVSRMLALRQMLNDPTSRTALKQQYEKLENTMFLRELKAIQQPLKKDSPEAAGFKGPMLYQKMRQSFKMVDFDSETYEQLAPRFGFMQLFGQNLRMGAELGKPGANAFKIFFDNADPSKADKAPTNSKDVDDAYNFIINVITTEVGPNGFATKMSEWITEGIGEINRRAKEQYGVEVIPDPYNTVWKDYFSNAERVLDNIKQRVEAQDGASQLDAKRQFVIDAVAIARSQTGLFLAQNDILRHSNTAKYSPSI